MSVDIKDVPADLEIPPLSGGTPAPGKRVALKLPAFEGSEIRHLLYLPPDWKPGLKLPVIVEYAGNGPYLDAFGDSSDGSVEGSKMGYGMSGGKGFIWLCLPFVDLAAGRNQAQWWGDPDATAAYCVKALEDVCERYGGDRNALILCGFSRGGIASNFIGLRNDEIAKLWRAFVPFSHYDGVRTDWGYPGCDRASALERLKRLEGRPQFICNEGDSCEETEKYLASTGIAGNFRFQPTGFRNHNDAWLLRDGQARRELRAWLANALTR